jgi:hypothetical protein
VDEAPSGLMPSYLRTVATVVDQAVCPWRVQHKQCLVNVGSLEPYDHA